MSNLMDKYNWTQVTERRIGKCLPVLMKKLNLKEVTANQKVKEKFNIKEKGYPKIILSEDKVPSSSIRDSGKRRSA